MARSPAKAAVPVELIGLAAGSSGLAAIRLRLQPQTGLQQAQADGAWWWPASADLPALLVEALRELRLRRESLFLSLPLADYRLLSMEAPEVPEAEFALALPFKVQESTDLSAAEVVVDWLDVPGIKPRPRRLLYAVAAPRPQLSGWVMACGKRTPHLGLRELALRNLACWLGQEAAPPGQPTGLPLGVVLVHLIPGEARLVLARGARFYFSRTLDLGGWLDEEVLPADDLRFESLALEIQRSLDYFDSQFLDPPMRQLLIVPAMAGAAELARYLADYLRLPARVWPEPEGPAADVARTGPQSVAAALAGLPPSARPLGVVALGAALEPLLAEAEVAPS